jgi:hypothetical protein
MRATGTSLSTVTRLTSKVFFFFLLLPRVAAFSLLKILQGNLSDVDTTRFLEPLYKRTLNDRTLVSCRHLSIWSDSLTSSDTSPLCPHSTPYVWRWMVVWNRFLWGSQFFEVRRVVLNRFCGLLFCEVVWNRLLCSVLFCEVWLFGVRVM